MAARRVNAPAVTAERARVVGMWDTGLDGDRHCQSEEVGSAYVDHTVVTGIGLAAQTLCCDTADLSHCTWSSYDVNSARNT